MIDMYCPGCDRGYTEEIDKLTDYLIVEEKIGSLGKEVLLYKCNDCGYEFIVGERKI